MSEAKNQHQEALQVLNNYYTSLAEKMAAEIVARREDFESPGFSSQPDDLIEKYARHIQQLGQVYSILRWKAHREKPEGKGPLGRYDFRCFGCGGVIQSTEDVCTICGWSWK
jgi:hypothetical protein